MVRIDMTSKPATGEGWNLYEVAKSELSYSKDKDHQMFVVELRGVQERNLEIKDWIMLEGSGWGMGLDKLAALGVPLLPDVDIHADQLEGRRVLVFGMIESKPYTGKDGKDREGRRLVVDKSKGNAGYCSVNSPPPGVTVPSTAPAAIDDDSTPF